MFLEVLQRDILPGKEFKNLRTILESRLENLAHSCLKQIPSRTWLSLSVSFKITLSRQDYLWVLAVNPASEAKLVS